LSNGTPNIPNLAYLIQMLIHSHTQWKGKPFPTNAWMAYYKLTNLLYISDKNFHCKENILKMGRKEGKKGEREKKTSKSS